MNRARPCLAERRLRLSASYAPSGTSVKYARRTSEAVRGLVGRYSHIDEHSLLCLSGTHFSPETDAYQLVTPGRYAKFLKGIRRLRLPKLSRRN